MEVHIFIDVYFPFLVEENAVKKKQGYIQKITRLFLFLIIIIAIFVTGGVLYQFFATRNDLSKYAPPGKMVPLNDILFHLYCTGSGTPTIILESGAGDYSLGWVRVQPELSEHTRVCSYDRAGFGWSEEGAPPRDSVEIANELLALLDQAGETGPYILVGHSRGGFFVRQLAALIPNEISAIILVDAKSEQESQYLPDEFSAFIDKATSQQNSMCTTFFSFWNCSYFRIHPSHRFTSRSPGN